MVNILILLFVLCIGSLFAKIAIYGDTRTQDDIHAKVVLRIASHKPSLAFHTGDLVNSGTTQAEYDKFHAISKPLTDICVLYPAKGNHEKNRMLFLENFPILNDRTYYKLVADSLVFLILDTTMRVSVGSEQYLWLEEQLQQNLDMPVFIILHHPIFSSGRHGDELGLGLFMPQLLSKYNVKAVFAGHDHGYERSFYKGIFYITTAGGGAPLYQQDSVNKHSQVYKSTYNYVICTVADNKVIFKVYDLQDEIVDSFETAR